MQVAELTLDDFLRHAGHGFGGIAEQALLLRGVEQIESDGRNSSTTILSITDSASAGIGSPAGKPTGLRISFGRDRSSRLSYQAALTSIFFSGFCASGFFGRVTLSTPLLNVASILLASTVSGTWKQRSKEPKCRSCR